MNMYIKLDLHEISYHCTCYISQITVEGACIFENYRIVTYSKYRMQFFDMLTSIHSLTDFFIVF